MRQSKAVGRTMAGARRVALTSLGAGLAVGAAAPLASAATVADAAPFASAASVADAAPPASAGSVADAAPASSSSPLGHAVPLVAAPATANLADSALTFSEAALSRANANWARLGHLKLYPLAGTGLDPLSNMVSTSLGGIPISTQPVTQMVEDGLPVTDLPVVGALLNTPRD